MTRYIWEKWDFKGQGALWAFNYFKFFQPYFNYLCFQLYFNSSETETDELSKKMRHEGYIICQNQVRIDDSQNIRPFTRPISFLQDLLFLESWKNFFPKGFKSKP